MSGLFYGVPALDPIVFACATRLLLATAALASYVPSDWRPEWTRSWR